ncbi:N-acetyltransferase family protein [Nocardioides sp. SYSU DS0663]|uniref:GNAT family N-acetyltransferase n=1 Tax=Nocardioides sp. SYSU DS0663 TaxID=3416445 RepID=UPI003F4B3DBD
MTLVEMADLAPADRDRLQEIYEASFPEELTAPFEDLLADRLLAYVDAEGPAGLALVRDLGPTTWTFLRYYAVGRRGRGTGSAMWAHLTALLAQEGRTRLVWDVEDPAEEGLSAALVEEHRRRIAFYERLGGRLLPVREYLPPHDDGHTPRLLLMDTLLGDGDGAGLREVVEGVYRWRYGLGPDDPVVHRTLRASNLY